MTTMSHSAPVLEYRDVTVTYPNNTRAACEVNLTVQAGECLALVGESGCGKTTLARAALGLLPRGTRVSGSIRVAGREIVGASPETLRGVRGLIAGFVAQNPFAACNPLDRVGTHVAEAWRAHGLGPPPGAIVAELGALGIDDAARRARLYPHQWSGGMLQRAVIAAAAAHRPALLIADEPTSALDSERRAAILDSLRTTRSAALLLISHDLRAVAAHADKVAVCRAGRVVETGTTADVLNCPQHPYTIELLKASAGEVAPDIARSAESDLAGRPVVLEARDLGRAYEHGGADIRAVAGIDLRVRAGEIIGVHGPSGCGKSTLLGLLAAIEFPTTGSVTMAGGLTTKAGSARLYNPLARRGFVMPIFQDPVGSLDRRWPVWRTITEPLAAPHRADRPGRAERRTLARHLMDEIGLAGVDQNARPDELSVGQCQRVSIARALATEPALIVADEPTSALDVITAANILRLLAAAARKGTAVVIVSHDRTLLRGLCHRVLSMRGGMLES